MLRFGRLTNSAPALGRYGATLAVATVGLGLISCSTDFKRFEAPVLGYSGAATSEDVRSAQSGSAQGGGSFYDQRSTANSGGSPSRYGGGAAPQGDRAAYSKMADASPSGDLTTGSTRQQTDVRYTPQSLDASRQPAYQPRSSAPLNGGGKITVRSGDTLYDLARQHGVSVSEIKRANGLTSNIIRPGQQLYLSTNSAPAREPTRVAAATRFEPRSPVPSTGGTVGGADTYTVRPGDSLYAISRRTGVRVATLRDLNDIRDVRRMMPGTVLKLRGETAGGYEPRTGGMATARRDEPAPRMTAVRTTTTPIILNPKRDQRVTTPENRAEPASDRIDNRQRSAARSARPEAAAQSASATPGKFRWPVNGRIVRGFGSRADGSKNDGINIAVPVGTDIHAAEAGVVAYAGNELKGYGNLILVRHDNGYVTAYAHSDRMLVRRGDAVRRGQVIAKAGKTGSVSQPQLHFELRQGAKPVDPMPYLGRI